MTMTTTNLTEEEFFRAVRMPDKTDVPAVFAEHVTPELREAIETRDAIYDEWVDIEDAAVAAHHDVGAARERDAQALREAVAAGKADPGEKHKAKAERALVVAVERVRQATERVRSADSAVRSQYRATLPRLVPVALAAARAGVEQYRKAYADAQATLNAADRELSASYAGLQEIRELVRPMLQYTPPSLTPKAKISDTDVIGLLGRVEQLCDAIEDVDLARPTEATATAAAE